MKKPSSCGHAVRRQIGDCSLPASQGQFKGQLLFKFLFRYGNKLHLCGKFVNGIFRNVCIGFFVA
jgi:hypothetical protein